MKKDSNTLEIPSNGVVVNEEYELAQLADCCLYVLPSNVQLDGRQVKTRLDELTCWSGFVNKYETEVLDELPCMCNHPRLETAVKKLDYNLIMSMNEPGASVGKQYLLMKTEENSLNRDIASMLSVAEEVTKRSIHDLMIKHAVYSPESFFRFSEHIWESETFWKNYVARRIQDFSRRNMYAMPPSYSYLKKKLGLDDILTHRKKMELQEKFIKNLKAIKDNENDDIARAEVKVVLECLNINNYDMLSYLKMIPEDSIEQFCNKVIPKRIAEASNMTMEVKYEGSVDVQRPADGRFRLHLHKNGQDLQVHFKRRGACALYLIYLMDICQSESVDTLNIKDDYETAFRDLFNQVYYVGGATYFKTMFGKGASEQELFRHCLSDIRISIGNACEMLHEAAAPYVLKDPYSHLCILKQNVKIDRRLIAPTTV